MAIVGTLGPPEAPIYSAIGDMVNTAARFEDMTKAFGCTLVVSEEALRQAGIEPGDSPQHQVRVRGKTERLTVYASTQIPEAPLVFRVGYRSWCARAERWYSPGARRARGSARARRPGSRG